MHFFSSLLLSALVATMSAAPNSAQTRSVATDNYGQDYGKDVHGYGQDTKDYGQDTKDYGQDVEDSKDYGDDSGYDSNGNAKDYTEDYGEEDSKDYGDDDTQDHEDDVKEPCDTDKTPVTEHTDDYSQEDDASYGEEVNSHDQESYDQESYDTESYGQESHDTEAYDQESYGQESHDTESYGQQESSYGQDVSPINDKPRRSKRCVCDGRRRGGRRGRRGGRRGRKPKGPQEEEEEQVDYTKDDKPPTTTAYPTAPVNNSAYPATAPAKDYGKDADAADDYSADY